MAIRTADQLTAPEGAALAEWHANIEAACPAQPARDWRTDRIRDLTNLLAEAVAWNAYATRRSVVPVETDPAQVAALNALQNELDELTAEANVA